MRREKKTRKNTFIIEFSEIVIINVEFQIAYFFFLVLIVVACFCTLRKKNRKYQVNWKLNDNFKFCKRNAFSQYRFIIGFEYDSFIDKPTKSVVVIKRKPNYHKQSLNDHFHTLFNDSSTSTCLFVKTSNSSHFRCTFSCAFFGASFFFGVNWRRCPRPDCLRATVQKEKTLIVGR